jgi:hypothetical protein
MTIPIGYCDNEDKVLKRLRTIEAILCGKYLANRYHKLPDEARFSMAVAFEGEVRLGTRHAHILAYIPTPTKQRIPQSMLSNFFPFEFRFQWNKLELSSAQTESEYRWARARDPWADIKITPANTARDVYTVKDVRQADVSRSRFEFVTPPKFETFKNENLSVIRNRDRQKRAVLAHAQA